MPVSVSLPLLLHIYFHDSRSFFLFLKDSLNAPFTLYNLSCMSLGHSTYHRQQSVQLSVMVVIIFSISPHTSPEQVLNGFTSFALQQLENAPLFWAKKCRAWPGSPQPSASRRSVQLWVFLPYAAAMLLDTPGISTIWRYQSKPLTYHPAHTLQRWPGSARGLSLQLRQACRPP